MFNLSKETGVIVSRLQRPYLTITLVATTLIAVGTSSVMYTALINSLIAKEKSLTLNLAQALSDPMAIGEYDRMEKLLLLAKQGDEDMAYGTVISPGDGRVICTTEKDQKNQILNATPLDLEAPKVTTLRLVPTQNWNIWEADVPIESAGSLAGILRIGFSSQHVALVTGFAIALIFTISAIALILKSVLYRKLTNKYILAPIKRAVEQSERIARGELVELIEDANDDEIGHLMIAMNEMVAYLRKMAALADSIARGDLTVTVAPKSASDTFGNAFKKMVDNLHSIVRELADSSRNLNSTAITLSTASEQQSAIVSQQASSIQESVIILGEIRRTVDQARATAKSVLEISAQTLELSRKGQATLGQAVGVMAKIAEITTSVNDIAEQSKLLALNAAIEAAKAGSAGVGFAIVADEVRGLALESKSATANISAILDEIHGQVNETARNFSKLSEVIMASSDAAKEIATITYQQVNSIEQIASGMEQLSQASFESVEGAEQQSKSAQSLKTQAGIIGDIVGQYLLKEQLTFAAREHERVP